jgi:hypothetical protein
VAASAAMPAAWLPVAPRSRSGGAARELIGKDELGDVDGQRDRLTDRDLMGALEEAEQRAVAEAYDRACSSGGRCTAAGRAIRTASQAGSSGPWRWPGSRRAPSPAAIADLAPPPAERPGAFLLLSGSRPGARGTGFSGPMETNGHARD